MSVWQLVTTVAAIIRYSGNIPVASLSYPFIYRSVVALQLSVQN